MSPTGVLATPRDQVRNGVHWATKHGFARWAIRTAARRGDLQARLIEATRGDTAGVVEAVEALRAAGPVHRSVLGYVVTTHAGVREVLSNDDFTTYRPEPPGLFGAVSIRTKPGDLLHPLERPSLLATDPPDHARYRKMVTGVFTKRAVERLRGRTEEIAHALLDALEPYAHEPVDLVERYCAPLPVTVIAEVLGVPESEHDAVLAYGTAAAPSLDMGLSWRQHQDVERGLRQFDRWLGAHLERLRDLPSDALMSQLVAARDEQGGLDDRELRATAGLVLAAGFETTVNLLGNGAALLDEHRDQRRLLLAEGGWLNAAEEALRLDPPVLLTGRRASRDSEVAGVRVPEGATVATVLFGANRDPEVFDDPHRFDVTRANARDHIAFSSGRHHCLGAALARMEGEVGLQVLHERFPDLQVLPGGERRSTRILRGYERLPVLLRPT